MQARTELTVSGQDTATLSTHRLPLPPLIPEWVIGHYALRGSPGLTYDHT